MAGMLAERRWLMLARGIFALLFGLLALIFPGRTILALVLLFAAYMTVDGAFALVAGVRSMRAHQQWGLLFLQGIASLIAAAVAILWPAITVLVFVLLTAAWAIVSGSLMCMTAFAMTERSRWWLLVGGAASLLYGMLMIVMPLIGALVLTWWIGAYAVVLGVSLIVLTLSLPKRNLHHTGMRATAA
jgi:uncharacterized membrane protein HdeD (DUF308 family)